jgi:hypothetical protein
MAITVVHHTPTLTQERYEAVVRGLTGGKQRLDSPADLPTTGLLVHVAAQTDAGFIVFDVFESDEAFDRFRAVASPIATEAALKSLRRATRCIPTSRSDSPWPVSDARIARIPRAPAGPDLSATSTCESLAIHR